MAKKNDMASEVTKDDVKDAKVRTSPVEFFTQTRQEIAKVTWPTRKETGITALMVAIMVVISMLFFFAVDSILGYAMRLLLGLGG